MLEKYLTELRGAIFQKPPLVSAVKKELRVRHIYDSKLLDFNKEDGLGVFWIKCEAGTYVRTLCQHIGLLMGCGA